MTKSRNILPPRGAKTPSMPKHKNPVGINVFEKAVKEPLLGPETLQAMYGAERYDTHTYGLPCDVTGHCTGRYRTPGSISGYSATSSIDSCGD